jgi:uncharacterized protein YbjT (DUF2867 family)
MIVVTSPTGLIGHQAVLNLLQHSEPVRVIVRDPSRLADSVRDRVDIVQGSHGDAAVVDQAFEGADAVFWLVPPDSKAESVHAAYVDFSRPAAEAITRHRVGRVVSVSALGRGTPQAQQAGYVTASLAVDDLIMSTGANFRALTMPSFMDNLVRQAGAIKSQGAFYSPISGDHRLPSVATRDIAAVAAGLLLDHTWTGQGEVPVLGPEDLSFDDMARIMAEVLGTPVRFQQIAPEAYKANMMRVGLSDAMAQGMLDMAMAKDQGLDNAEPRTPQGTTPTSFRQWAEDTLRPAVQG